MTLEGLREHIGAVVAYNWTDEYHDAIEHADECPLEHHIFHNLMALAEFIGQPISEEDLAELTRAFAKGAEE